MVAPEEAVDHMVNFWENVSKHLQADMGQIGSVYNLLSALPLHAHVAAHFAPTSPMSGDFVT